MNKSAVVCGKELRLTSCLSAMVMKDYGKPPLCRTIYEDQDDALWCICDGAYHRVRRIDGSDLKRGYRSNAMYEICD